MNLQINNPSINSLEISNLVEKRHDSVKRTIETLIEKGVISQPQIVDGEKSANGIVPKLYVFSGDQGKRDSIVVVAQLSPEFTARLVDRWQELEQKLSSNVPVIKDPQLAAMVTMLTQLDAVKQEQQAQRLELSELKAKVTQSPQDYYTVAGYASLRGVPLDVRKAAQYGKLATRLSREQDMYVGKYHSEAYGNVNTYHVDILYSVFQD